VVDWDKRYERILKYQQTSSLAAQVGHYNAAKAVAEHEYQAADAAAGVRSQASLTPEQESKAWTTIAHQYSDRWGTFDRRFVDITPMGAAATVNGTIRHSMPATLINAYNQSISYFSAAAGDEYLSSYLMTMGNSDAQTRQASLAALNRIIGGGTLAPERQGFLVHGPGVGAAVGILSPEEFGKVVADPSQFNKLIHEQQATFIQHAQEVVDAYEQRGGQADAVKRSVQAIATGNLSVTLNDDEAADLQNYVKRLKRVQAQAEAQGLGGDLSASFMDAALAGAKFPHEVKSDMGQHILRIDPEWARQHPAKATTEAYYLQQAFPDYKVEFGDGPGLAGTIFNALGRPVDAVLALPSAAINVLSDGARKAIDDGDVTELQAARKEAIDKLADVTSPTTRAALLHTVDKLNDRIGLKTGQGDGFWDLVDHALYETPANLGFAENIVQGTGLLPGDRGYEAAIGVTAVVGSVAADPLTWAAGVAEGARAASTIPRVVASAEAGGEVLYDGAKAVRGLISRFVYERLAVTPEQWMKGAIGDSAVKNLAELHAALPIEDYTTLLQSSISDSFARNLIVAAGSDERALRSTLTQLMTNYTTGSDIITVHNRIQSIAHKLNELDRLEDAQHIAQTATNAEYAARVDRLEQHAAELVDAGLDGTPEHLATMDELNDLRAAGPGRAPVVDPRDLDRLERMQTRLDELENADQLDSPEAMALKDEMLGMQASPGPDMTFEEWKAARMAGEDQTIMVDRSWLASRTSNPSPRGAADVVGQGYPEIKANMAAEGWDRTRPLHVVYDYKAETFTIYDGTHRLALADELGISKIPVEFSGNADMANTFKMLQREFPDALRGPGLETSTMADATARLDALRATAVDDRAELIFLNNVRRGKTETAMPITYGDLRQLNKTGHEYARAIYELQRDLPDFPLDPGMVTSKAMRYSGHNILKHLRDIFSAPFAPTGLEGAEAWAKFPRGIALPGVDLGEATVDALERTRVNLASAGKLLGVPDEVVARQLGQWDRLVLLGSREDSYQWFKNTWQTFVLESEKLDAGGKAALSDIWHTPFEQWGSDTVRTSAPGEVITSEPLGYKLIPDPDGDGLLQAGQPVFSADSLNSVVFLPDMRKVMGVLHPKMARYVNSDGVTLATNFWKRAVLTSRMPFALPARIVGELLFGRMSAFDLASVSNWGVLDWGRSVMGTGRFAQWTEDEAFALGHMIEGLGDEGRSFNRALGLGIMTSRDGEDYYRALSGRMGYIASSPETRYALDAASPEEFVALLNDPNAPAALQDVARHWDAMEGGRDAVGAKVWKYLNEDLVGTGDYSESVRALLLGATGPDGEAVGSVALANRLKLNAQTGRWYPGVHDVHGKYAVGLDSVARPDVNALTRLNDAMFKKLYGWPEKRLGRLPAYRQMAQQDFERLVAMGYPEETAHAIARASSMRKTSDIFFKIGAHTSGEWMMKNISPFFPAWREVTDTWLLRIPQRLGGGSRIIGTAYMARRANLLFDALTHFGVITTGPDGKHRLGLPFLNPLVQFLLPGDEEVNVTASVDSLFGVIPFPSLDPGKWTDQINAMLPGLGGGIGVPAQMAGVFALDRVNPGWQQDLADLIAPYGVGTIGANVDRFYAAMALAVGMDPIAPWTKYTNPEFREQMVNSSIDDAIRTVVARGGKYAPPKGFQGELTAEQLTAAGKQYSAWVDRVMGAAEHLASAQYFTRGILSSILPMSTNLSTAESDSMDAIWTMLNDLPEGAKNSAIGPMLESFKAAYPYADWLAVGKSEALGARGQTTPEQDADMEAVFSAGMRRIRTPEEYMAWAYGMQSYSAYLAKKSAVYAKFEGNPVDYLLNGADARERIAKLDAGWQHYLTNMDEVQGRDGLQRTFKDLFDDAFNKTHPGRSTVQIESETIKNILPSIIDHVESGTYEDFRRQLLNNVKFLANNEGGMWTTLNGYYKKVADPYYRHLDKLYEAVNSYADEDPRKSQAYAAIRAYTSRQRPTTIDGYTFPTPEQTSFYTKSDEERTQWAVRKLSYGHPEWLTNFEQSVLGFGEGKGVKQLTNFTTQQRQQFDEAYPTTSTPGYYDAKARLDRTIQAKAKSLGISYAQWNAPLYQKASRAGLGSGPGFQQAVQDANQVKQSLAGGDLTLGSTSVRAAPAQKWLFTQLNALYQNDTGFQDFVDQSAVGLADDPANPLSRQDVFWRVFLDGYGGAPSYLYA